MFLYAVAELNDIVEGAFFLEDDGGLFGVVPESGRFYFAVEVGEFFKGVGEVKDDL